MEIIQPVWEIGKCLWVPLKRQIKYVRKIPENFEKLNEEAEDLYDRKVFVDREIESDSSKMVTRECEVWLKKVDEIKNIMNGIEAKFKENKKCFGNWCPNIWWRMKLGKSILSMREDIAKLKKKSKFKGGVLVVAPPKIVETTPSTTIEANTSTGCTVQEILRCLRDEKVKKIGVWGMGGVGKTTVLKNLNNSQEIIQMFQIVIWVTVSKEWTVRKVQQEIANRCSLTLEDNESNDRVSRKLFEKLGTMKYLLLLDDMWDRVDLEAVGVPSPTREDGCKIILTSRFLNVCQQMETDKEIKVEIMSQKEAWDLFHKKVGDVVDSSNIEPLARKVIEECGGLPLVLIVIGRSLRKVNDVNVWSKALTKLRRATFQIYDMEKSVFIQLKFSYDQLKDDNVKNCFLYCALYPEDFEIPIPQLIEHWWTEGFIDGNLNFGEAYDEGHAILNDLTNACLLERIEYHNLRLVKVKMHDVIRDLALRITSSEGKGLCRYVVNAGVGIMAMPNEEDWEQAEKMSLMLSNLRFLPMSPNCTFLGTLLLQNTNNWKEISELESFFEHMHSLRVLNLSGTDIKELPRSLLNLTSLRGLYLYPCYELQTLPSRVGHLTRLEVLHLGSYVNYLPIEFGKLTYLKSLRVKFNSGCSETPTDIIPNGLLSRLTSLEDLRIRMDRRTLELWYNKYTKAVVGELVGLKQLISLYFYFPKVEYLEYFLQRSYHWNEQPFFKSFRFFVGMSMMYRSPLPDRYLALTQDDDIISSVVIGEVLYQSRAFCLENNKSCKKLSDFWSLEMMNGLECCRIYNCDAIETLIDGNGLPNLEDLNLEILPQLRSIWVETVPPQSEFLRVLEITDCPKLSNIFSRGMIQHLSNLEELNVNGYMEIEEIVSDKDMAMVVDNDEDVAVVLFPRLKQLQLWDLPKLDRICKRVPNPIAWPSLQRLYIQDCPNLKNFPLSSSQAPALIGVSEEAVELEYEDAATKEHVSCLLYVGI